MGQTPIQTNHSDGEISISFIYTALLSKMVGSVRLPIVPYCSSPVCMTVVVYKVTFIMVLLGNYNLIILNNIVVY
jgi:hypothetical protein